MCVVGRLEGSEREIMTLVVVDGPRAKSKFGADVAGPSAMAILRRAHGLEPWPRRVAQLAVAAPDPDAFNARDQAWADAVEPLDAVAVRAAQQQQRRRGAARDSQGGRGAVRTQRPGGGR